MKFIDTHAHIFDTAFEKDRTSMLTRAYEAGVEAVYMPNLDVQSMASMLEVEAVSMAHPNTMPRCYVCLGLHPCYVESETYRPSLERIGEALSSRDCAGIGETGLDAYHAKAHLPAQQEALQVHIAWAKQYNKPLILHARNTLPLLLDTIAQHQGEVLGVFHCFTGTYAQAVRAIDMGFKLGLGGVISYKSSTELRQLIAQVPLDAWVLETDSPYLAPAGAKSRRNEPSYLTLIANQMAKCAQVSVEEVACRTTQNAHLLFDSSRA